MISRRHMLAAPIVLGGASKPYEALDYRLFDSRVLAPPTFEPIRAIGELSVPIVEIGAGNGYWIRAMRGSEVACAGYDINPQGPDVIKGDHAAAAREAPAGAALLAVWPPDNQEVQRWIMARAWSAVILVGDEMRFQVGDTLGRFNQTRGVAMAAGRKYGNAMLIHYNG